MTDITLTRRYQVLASRMQLDIWATSLLAVQQKMLLDHPEIKEYKVFPPDHLPKMLDLDDYNDILSACNDDEEKAAAFAWWLEKKGYI